MIGGARARMAAARAAAAPAAAVRVAAARAAAARAAAARVAAARVVAAPVAAALVVAASLAGCGGSLPATQFYELSPAAAPLRARGAAGTGPASSRPVLVVEPFEAAGIYDDDRIVYRTGTYRLDRYVYRRWSAPPGRLVSEFISQALAQSGRFRAVTAQMTPDATAVLRGRLLAIEEVDVSARHWVGHIALELQLEDARSGELLWSGRFDRRRPLTRRDPEGLAEALSAVLSDITVELTPAIARAAATARPDGEPSPPDS